MLTFHHLWLKMHLYFKYFQHTDHPSINQNPKVREPSLKKNDTILIFHNIISLQTIITCERVWSTFNKKKSTSDRKEKVSFKERKNVLSNCIDILHIFLLGKKGS